MTRHSDPQQIPMGMTGKTVGTPQVPALPGMTPLGIAPRTLESTAKRYAANTVADGIAELIKVDASLKQANPEDLQRGIERIVIDAYVAGTQATKKDDSMTNTNKKGEHERPDEIALRASKCSEARDHRGAEELYLLAAARASAYTNQPSMKANAKVWDRCAARERRLAELKK